jgi:hypothetical protein
MVLVEMILQLVVSVEGPLNVLHRTHEAENLVLQRLAPIQGSNPCWMIKSKLRNVA